MCRSENVTGQRTELRPNQPPPPHPTGFSIQPSTCPCSRDHLYTISILSNSPTLRFGPEAQYVGHRLVFAGTSLNDTQDTNGWYPTKETTSSNSAYLNYSHKRYQPQMNSWKRLSVGTSHEAVCLCIPVIGNHKQREWCCIQVLLVSFSWPSGWPL